MTSGRSHFHNRILSLQRAVLAVGREVQRSIADATDAWLRRDCVAGEAVNARTAGWSARARDIELAVYALLATQQPMASDLRRLTALVRLTEEVARSVTWWPTWPARPASSGPPTTSHHLCEPSWSRWPRWPPASSATPWPPSKRGRRSRRGGGDADAELDLLHRELFAALLEGAADTAPAIDLALLGRFYERLGDHAVEIAGRMNFVATGASPSRSYSEPPISPV